MKHKFFIVNVILVLLWVQVASAQNLTKAGTTASQFLKIDVGPRAIGMGGAYTATANDISAMYWNPAGLASNYGGEAFFNHVEWFADINLDYAAVAAHIPEVGTIGVSVAVLSMDEMLVRTIELPEGIGEFFNAGALSIGLGFARELTDNFSIGFQVKYIRDYIWNSSAAGFALDVGTIYKIHFLNEVRIASSISNFGTKMKLDGRDILLTHQVGTGTGNLINTEIKLEEFDLPLVFRMGLAADLIKTEDIRITTAVDAIHPNDHTEYLNTGIECGWNEILFLRGGMKSIYERDTEQGWTVGAGINYNVLGSVHLKLDYAYQNFGRLKEVQYLSLGVKF